MLTSALLLAGLLPGCAGQSPAQSPARGPTPPPVPPSDCVARPLDVAGGVVGLRPVREGESLPGAVCAWMAAVERSGGMLTLSEGGATYLIAAPGPAGAVTVTSLEWGQGVVHVGYRVAGEQPGGAGVAVLEGGSASGAPPIVLNPEEGSRWIPLVLNTHGLPPAPLPDYGAAITAASHDLVCPGRVVVSGFAMVNEDVVLVRVRDADGAPLGEVQSEAGGGRGNWGSFVITVPLERQPAGESGTVEVLDIRGDDWVLSDSASLSFGPDREPAFAVEADPGRAWEPKAEELTVMGAPLRATLPELEAVRGKGSSFDGRTYVFGNDAVRAYFPYQAHLQARAHRLVTTRGGTGAGAEVRQCAEELIARLGKPQAMAADGREWYYLSPASHAALAVRFGAGGLVSGLELFSHYPAPEADLPAPPALDEAAARDLLRRYRQADWFQRAELLTTGGASAYWWKWMSMDPGIAVPEDWSVDGARLAVEPAGEGTLVHMEYVSGVTGEEATVTWRLEPAGGVWRIAAWQRDGRWEP